MTEHKDIQDPKKFSEAHYKFFEAKLFSTKTSKEELEEICMTLAHLPTKDAQDLLEKFKQSERAKEVEWLECAIDEGKFHYLCSNNEKEERDMIALKLYFRKENEIVELMGKCQTYEFRLQQYNIELDALKKLQKEKLSEPEKEDIKYRILALKDIIAIEQSKLDETNTDIKMMEKINKKIKKSVTTKRYQNLQFWDLDEIHFDGEE